MVYIVLFFLIVVSGLYINSIVNAHANISAKNNYKGGYTSLIFVIISAVLSVWFWYLTH